MLKTLLIIALLLFLFWPLIRFIIIINRARKQFHNQQQAFRNAYSHEDEENSERTHRKIFNKNDGEYVEYEELPSTSSANNSSYNNTTTDDAQTSDPQISDAEWEDIK